MRPNLGAAVLLLSLLLLLLSGSDGGGAQASLFDGSGKKKPSSSPSSSAGAAPQQQQQSDNALRAAVDVQRRQQRVQITLKGTQQSDFQVVSAGKKRGEGGRRSEEFEEEEEEEEGGGGEGRETGAREGEGQTEPVSAADAQLDDSARNGDVVVRVALRQKIQSFSRTAAGAVLPVVAGSAEGTKSSGGGAEDGEAADDEGNDNVEVQSSASETVDDGEDDLSILRCVLPSALRPQVYSYGGFGGAVVDPVAELALEQQSQGSRDASTDDQEVVSEEDAEAARERERAARVHRELEEVQRLMSHTWARLSSASQKKEFCMYRHEGWWSYEVCPKKSVRQFHVEQNQPPKPELDFRLGNRVAGLEARKINVEQHPKYFSESFVEGTRCDLTGQPRKSEVRYQCNAERLTPQIVDISEPSACEYRIVIETATLCEHPLFRPSALSSSVIECTVESVAGARPAEVVDAAFLFPPAPKLDLRDPQGRPFSRKTVESDLAELAKDARGSAQPRESDGWRQFSTNPEDRVAGGGVAAAADPASTPTVKPELIAALKKIASELNGRDRRPDGHGAEGAVDTDDVADEDDDDDEENDLDASNLQVVWVDGQSPEERRKVEQLLASIGVAFESGSSGDEDGGESESNSEEGEEDVGEDADAGEEDGYEPAEGDDEEASAGGDETETGRRSE